MKIKKVLSIMLVLCMLLVSSVSAESNPANQLNGFVSTQDNGNITALADLSNIMLNESVESVELSFNYNKDLVKISAAQSKLDAKNSIVYYEGNASIADNNYLASLVSNTYGISGLIYNNDRSIIVPFSISKNGSMKEKSNKYNKQVNQLKAQGLWKEPSIKYEVIDEENNNAIIGPLSTIYYKSIRITNDGYSVPFLLSSGAVDGTLYYETGTQIQLENPEAKFYADRLEGFVSWNTSFDLMAIRNPNEPYGYLFSTPTNPPREVTTWNIGEYASYSGTYTLAGQISYTVLVDKAPVLYTNTKTVTIY